VIPQSHVICDVKQNDKSIDYIAINKSAQYKLKLWYACECVVYHVEGREDHKKKDHYE
jgi:hypothetical protein